MGPSEETPKDAIKPAKGARKTWFGPLSAGVDGLRLAANLTVGAGAVALSGV